MNTVGKKLALKIVMTDINPISLPEEGYLQMIFDDEGLPVGKLPALPIDSVPTLGSKNPIESGAVKEAIDAIENEISNINALTLGETSTTAYRGDRGKIAYNHSLTTGNPHSTTKSDIGLGNVGNFKAVSTEANQVLSTTEKSNARNNIGAGTSNFDGLYDSLTGIPTLGTAAALDVASSGNASATQVVKGDDSRLTNSRTPTAHNHSLSEIIDAGTAASKNVPVRGNATDTEVVLGNDTRLNNSRTPLSHTHTTSDIIDFPVLGTASTKNVPISGNASNTLVVMGDDSRLSDARQASDVSDWAKASTKPTYSYSEITNTPTIPTITDTYSGTSSNGMSGKAVKSAIDALDGTVSGSAGTNKTLTDFSQTDGKVSATFGNISITKSQVSDFPTLGTAAAKSFTTSVTSGSNDLVTSGAVYTAIDNLPEPMVFKGSLGTGGTITALPVNGTASIGDTYKVITDGTYASKTAKVGDTFICLTKTASANTWELIPSGDEPSGTVTSITIKANSPIAIDDAAAITTSGTRTISHENSGVTAGTYKSITVNATGHVTNGSNPTTLVGYGITDALSSSTKYAASSSTGGAASSAEKLTNTEKVGDTNKPVYFKADGTPAAISYTIDKSVPSDAVFTDHYAWNDITGKPSSYTPSSHTHGNIQNGGTLQTNDITIASGDKLVVTDSSDSAKVARASISFDGSTTTKALTQKGTWETFATTDTNTHRPIQVNGTQVLGDNTTALNLKAGSNVSITNSSGTVTFAATDTTYSAATQSAAGLMSSTDKTKLDGIATGATAVIESTVSGWGFTKNAGTVTSVKVGDTSYSPSSGVVSLPAYPTTLPASDVYSWAKASTKPTYTLDEVSDGSTRKLSNYLPLSGGTLSSSSFGGQLTIERTDGANIAVIGFKNTNGVLGYLGTNTKDSSLVRYNSDRSTHYTILDSANSSVSLSGSTLSVKIAGTTKSLTNTDTTYSAGTGLSLSSTTINHSNSITAQTTQGLYPIKIDALGHISAYGTAVTSLPASDVYSWAKASSKPSYTASEVGALPSTTTYAASSSVGGAATNALNLRLNHTTSSYDHPLVFGTSYTVDDSAQVLNIATPTTTGSNCPLRCKTYCAAANTQGESHILIGNNIKTDTANNSRGSLYLYGTGTKYIGLKAGAVSADREITLLNGNADVTVTTPEVSGTLVSKVSANIYTTNSASWIIFAKVSKTETSRGKDCTILLTGGGSFYDGAQNTGLWVIEMRSSNTGVPHMTAVCLIPPSTLTTVAFGYYTNDTEGITYFGMSSTGRRGEISIIPLVNSLNLFTIYSELTNLTSAPSGWTTVNYVKVTTTS